MTVTFKYENLLTAPIYFVFKSLKNKVTICPVSETSTQYRRTRLPCSNIYNYYFYIVWGFKLPQCQGL